MDLALLRAEGRERACFDAEDAVVVDCLKRPGETLGGDPGNDGRGRGLGVMLVEPDDRIDPLELLDEIDVDDIEPSRQPGVVGFFALETGHEFLGVPSGAGPQGVVDVVELVRDSEVKDPHLVTPHPVIFECFHVIRGVA